LIYRVKNLIQGKRIELIRFVKFCVVGTIGTAIDFGIFNLLHNVIGLHPVLSNTVSISAAITNNYLWSRYWVYPETKARQGGGKFLQFVIVSLIAWALNTGILWSSDRWIFGQSGILAALVSPLAQAVGLMHEVLASNLAKVLATGVVLFWNFFANRLWTFGDVDRVVQPATSTAEPIGDHPKQQITL
jgi:putative flippase GtrA